MEVRLTFVYNGVEVNLTTQTPGNLAKELNDLIENLDQGLGQKASIASKGIPQEPKFDTAPTPSITGNLQERVGALAAQMDLTLEQLSEVVHFGDDFPLLLKPIESTVRSKQQAKALLALGAVLDLVYQKPEVGLEFYGKLLRDSNIDNARLDHATSSLKGKFIGKGAGRGRTFEITVPGRREGLDILKELAQPSS